VFGNEFIRQQSCSCEQRKTPKKRRLLTLLVVIIMILLSITVGMAWKHLELLRTVRGQSETTVENNTSTILKISGNKD
jgi:hypothetical protein